MSHHEIQRVLVRMLFDPEFQEAVAANPESALAGLDLAANEKAWLVGVDPRAYRTDSLRRVRALKGLVEEFPASAALASEILGSIRVLEDFFSAPHFHSCIRQRGSLALSFGHYLEAMADQVRAAERRLGPIVRLELAIARVRRAPTTAGLRSVGERHLHRNERAEVLQVPGGTLELYQAIRGRLAHFDSDVVAALMHPKLRLRKMPALRGDRECLLVLRRIESDVTLEEIPPALAGLLEAAAKPRPVSELREEARRLGADPGQDQEILDGLIADGLLVEA